MKIFILSVLIFLFARPVFSEFNQHGGEQFSVIEPLYCEKVIWEEASFSKKKNQRDLAKIKEEKVNADFQWQGDLTVLDEIPHSYPQVSRSILQKRVLAEMGY